MDDWGRKPKEPTSVWLKLKAKGDKVRIRISTRPYREVQVWPSERGGNRVDQEMVNSFTPGQWVSIMRNPDWQVSEVYHLLVIDRSDGLAKIFQASSAIYGKIRAYAQDPEWGNPMGYDITIERTEKPGTYWEITPSPNKTDLMNSERNLVDTLVDKLPAGAIPASDPQPDDIDENTPPERLPWEWDQAPITNTLDPQPVKTNDVVIEDIGDDPINLDDIPFNDDPSMSEKGSNGKKNA